MNRTHRNRLAALLAAVLAAAVAAWSATAAPASHHDDAGTPLVDPSPLQPPAVTVLQRSNQDAPGYVFVAPKANVPTTVQQGPRSPTTTAARSGSMRCRPATRSGTSARSSTAGSRC